MCSHVYGVCVGLLGVIYVSEGDQDGNMFRMYVLASVPFSLMTTCIPCMCVHVCVQCICLSITLMCSRAPGYIIRDMVARCRLLAAHGAKSCQSVRAQPLTATGAPSQTFTDLYHTIPYHTQTNANVVHVHRLAADARTGASAFNFTFNLQGLGLAYGSSDFVMASVTISGNVGYIGVANKMYGQ